MELRKPVSAVDHIKGNINGRIELVEYGDYQCPYCGAAFPLVEKIMEMYSNPIKFAFRNFPLTKIHTSAKISAQAAEAAALQGKFWEMHHSLFTDQRHLLQRHIFEKAQSIGLDMEKFSADFIDETVTQKIEDDFYSGLRSGVNKTPTFFINGKRFDGEAVELIGYIETLL